MRAPEHLKGWDEFETRLRQLYEDRDQRERHENATHVSQLLFRGQSNANWQLTTTLERYALQNLSPTLLEADRYYGRIHAAKHQIEIYTNKRWEIDTPPEHSARLEGKSVFVHQWFEGQIYEYMVFLRHHGFPSPFLDWSRSPYVAAFFAFMNATPDVERVAIYAFLEYAGRGKTGSSQTPKITGLGPYTPAHKRHFLQQCEYTVCTIENINGRLYSSHQAALGSSEAGQDILWQFTLPAADRLNVLKILDRYNINSLSLFGSDESLMETMALRELVFRD